MKRWMVWLAAALAAILAAGLSVGQPSHSTAGSLASCAGSPPCTGPPARHAVVTAGRLPRVEKVPHEAAYRPKPRALTPAQPSLPSRPPWAVGSVVQAGGRTFRVTAKLRMSATTYTTGEPGVGRVTFTGTRARVGEAAVDPRFVPLGSWLYVVGYQTPYLPAGGLLEHAEDIGSLIKGDRIDLYMATSLQEVAAFGRQPVTVYVLTPWPALPDVVPGSTPN